MLSPKAKKLTNTDLLATMAASRAAATYFDKIERYELQETLAHSSYDWLLSTEETKITAEVPKGLISNVQIASDSNKCLFLLPAEDGVDDLELREVHQVVRELVTGIYVLNQTPSIHLEKNHDNSTSCQLPPAYCDTRVGQLLIEVDYLMKSLWHGAFFPKEKRTKFTERWRQLVNLNTHTGVAETKRNMQLVWTEGGVLDMSSDPQYSAAYEYMPVENLQDFNVQEQRHIFEKHAEDLSMVMTFYQKSVQHHGSMFVIDADYHISSTVKSDKVDIKSVEKLQKRLLRQEKFISDTLPTKPEVRHQLLLLKLISFLVPFLIALRKRCKIINVNKLLPGFTFEECKTEREFPPLVVTKDNKCNHFPIIDSYTHLHGGILVDRETGPVHEAGSDFIKIQDKLCEDSLSKYSKIVDAKSLMLEKYPLSTININNKKYYAIAFYLETFYPVSPKQPIWVHAHYEEIDKLKCKKLPIQEYLIYELFKKRYGHQRTMNLKQHFAGLQAASQRGMVGVIYSLARRLPTSKLFMQDASGLSLIHYAAMYNRPQVITLLAANGCDINVKRFSSIASQQGATPLHLAARCGALDSLSCLLAYKADVMLFDIQGWCPIHYAAYFNHRSCLGHLVHRDPDTVELRATSGRCETPVLLAASSGGLDAVQTLLELGASTVAADSEGNNVVHVATMHLHTNVLEFFIDKEDLEMSVWRILVEMLNSNVIKRQMNAAKALEVLSISKEGHWKAILDAGGVPALVSLLATKHEAIQATAVSVLCNIGDIMEIRQAMSEANAMPVIISLLRSSVPIIHSRAAVILADLSCIGENQESAGNDGLRSLVGLLKSDVEHVLVNAVNCIRILCESCPDNQERIAQIEDALVTLVELLNTKSRRLQANTAAALSAIARNNRFNQDLIASKQGALKGLVDLLNSKNPVCQVKAAIAIESLVVRNSNVQKLVEDAGAVKPLIRLLKIWTIEVKEQGASALWSLAGDAILQQRHIAEMIGIHIIVDMLMLKSEKLQYIAGMAIIALSKENFQNQRLIAQGGGIPPLVRLLRATTTPPKILLMVVEVLGTLCVGVAHQSHQAIQTEIANADALPTLVNIMRNCKDTVLQVEVANTLSKIALNNPKSHGILVEKTQFHISELLHFLKSSNVEVRLKVGTALGTFAFNNTVTQFEIGTAGGIPICCFEEFLHSNDEIQSAYAAFQTVVLARVIKDSDPVELSAKGVECLVQLLASENQRVKTLSASLVASLAHSRAGIPDGLITAGAIKLLFRNLMVSNEQVCGSAAVALGYLSFNGAGSREMLMRCRNMPELYEVLEHNLGCGKMSMNFVDSWKRATNAGLPCNSLEVNGGPPVPRKLTTAERRARPTTTQSLPMCAKETLKQRGKTVGIRYCASAPSIGNSSSRRSNLTSTQRSRETCHLDTRNKILKLRPSVENNINTIV